MFAKRFFSVFQILLLVLPAIFLLYLVRFWIWFLYPLPTNVLEFSTAVLLLMWLIGIWKFKFPKPVFSSRWQTISIYIFLIIATIATAKIVLHLDKGRSVPLGIWKGWIMAPACYFIMLVSTFRSKLEFKKIIDVTVGIIAITALVMTIQYFTGFFSEIITTYDGRLVWPYLDPMSGLGTSGNYPALFIAPFLCLSFISLLLSKQSLDRIYYIMVGLAMAVTVYFTKSYGAWLAIIGACAIASFFVSSGKKRWLLVPIMTLLLLVGLYFDQKNTEKFQYALDIDEELIISSGSERLNIWKVSWDLIKRDAIWGVGPGQFQRAFERQAPFTLGREVSRKEINHSLHPHNTYLMFWLSNGIFGLLSFLFLISVWAIPLPREWRWILLTPLLYYLFHGVIDVFYWKNDLAYSFWFFGGLMIIAQNLNFISGKVESGLKVGRELGFPTANIRLDLQLNKPYGVYIVILKIEKIKRKGLLYYGPRRTKGLPKNIVTEITVFDYDEDLYQKDIRFKIGKFIRGPMEFNSIEELKEQLEKDVLVAKYKK